MEGIKCVEISYRQSVIIAVLFTFPRVKGIILKALADFSCEEIAT